MLRVRVRARLRVRLSTWLRACWSVSSVATSSRTRAATPSPRSSWSSPCHARRPERFECATGSRFLTSPAGGAPVHAVAFLAGDRLATAVDGGETISLWTVAPGDAPRRDHALALARPPANTRPARARRVAAAGGGAFVLVTAAAPATDAAADESAGAALYVAHVDAETNKIDHVAPFAVSQPVLSLAALDADLTDDANDAEADAEPAGFEIQLFCVQTRAIQQYFLRPSALYPATTAPATTAPATAAAAAPATEDPPARQRATGRPLAVIF